MAKANTRATAKYQAKVGLVAKTYKLKANIADDFKRACTVKGESQAAALMRFMTEYTEKNGSGKIKQTQLDGQMEINSLVQSCEENAGNETAVLEKWAAQLKKATKKAGLPCVYQYGYGKSDPHIFVNNEKIFIPKDEITVLIRLGAVHENISAK